VYGCPPACRGNFCRGAITSLPGRNHLSQVSTTCSGCIYHTGRLPLTPPRTGSLRALPVDVRRPRAGVQRRRHIRARARARTRRSKSEWLIMETMMRNSTGDRKTTGDSFGRHAAGLSSASQLRPTDLPRPDDDRCAYNINKRDLASVRSTGAGRLYIIVSLPRFLHRAIANAPLRFVLCRTKRVADYV